MTMFKVTSYPVASLIEDIDCGKIGLPDIQRPFTWRDSQVRDLFDSLYKGYPAGALLFWETGVEGDLKEIGTKSSRTVPDIAILDGQQRLTSLYAVAIGRKVIRKDNREQQIKVSFNVFTEKFLVDHKISESDRYIIPDISELWKSEINAISAANSIIDKLSDYEELSAQRKEKIQSSIVKVHNMLARYHFPVLELSRSIGTEIAAEIFVRINGEGTQLKQSDFVMTLMSVIWDEGRNKIEKFATSAMDKNSDMDSQSNSILRPTSDQLLRSVVGFSLRKARLDEVYSALHEKRSGFDANSTLLEDLKAKLDAVLNMENWNSYVEALYLAGYCNEDMIRSKIAAMYSYVLYLIGVEDYNLERKAMQNTIAEYFFMASLTSRYSGSLETKFERDLTLMKGVSNGDDYVKKLRDICKVELTDEFWANALPSRLETTSSASPFLMSYYASLVIHDAYVMNSNEKIKDMLLRNSKPNRTPLFSKAVLHNRNIAEYKMVNQVANYIIGEWTGETPPDDNDLYQDTLFSSFEHTTLPYSRNDMYTYHALPQSWWDISYDEFLMERRKLMAGVIENAWRKLRGDQVRPRKIERDIEEIINSGESALVEFKSTLRTNLVTGMVEKNVHMTVLKAIASFLNTDGGKLLIGVDDKGKVLGVEKDEFSSHDQMVSHLGNVINNYIGGYFRPKIRSEFVKVRGRYVMVVQCQAGNRAAYLTENGRKKFYIRGDNGISELQGHELQDYLNSHFPKI